METEFLELMPSTITIEPFLSEDAYTERTYGPAFTCRCRIELADHEYHTASGQTATATAVVYLYNPMLNGQPWTPGKKDRYTLPNGEQPFVLGVTREIDDQGDYASILFLSERVLAAS